MIRRRNEPGAGRWSLPGGRLESGETLASGAAREALEETNLQLVVGNLLGSARLPRDETTDFLIYNFSAELSDVTAEPVAGTDASEAMFVAFRRFEELGLSDRLISWLARHGVGSGL